MKGHEIEVNLSIFTDMEFVSIIYNLEIIKHLFLLVIRRYEKHGYDESDTFLYFGFGSNLLKERLQIQNTSAVFKTIGRLDVSTNYRLQINF